MGKKYVCPKDCEAGDSIAGCLHLDYDKTFPPGTDLEEEGDYPICPLYPDVKRMNKEADND